MHIMVQEITATVTIFTT